MSGIAQITVSLIGPTSVWALLCTLERHGWRMRDRSGLVHIAPLHDGDSYHWEEKELSRNALKSLIQQKESENEQTAMVLWHNSTGVGVTFLASCPTEVCFLLDCHRVKIKDRRGIVTTDVNWYVQNLLWKLGRSNTITHFEFEEF